MGFVYSKMKIFHYKDKIDALPLSVNKILPPVHIRIKPTNVCNHNCSYCAYRSDHLQLGKDMRLGDSIPKEKMFEIIDDLEDMGVKAVTFSGGGEPFCYPFFIETLEKLSKTNIKFAALTNGSKLDGKAAEIFAEYGTWIRISIDGWDGTSYADYRNISENEFEKVINNISSFKHLNGKCYLGVNIIVDQINSNQILDFTKRLKDCGVNSVKVSPCIVSNNGKENNEYHSPIFHKVKSQLEEIKLLFADEDFEFFDSYHSQLETFSKKYSWCPYIQILPVIGADCNVYTCHDKAYNLENGLIASIKNERFKNIWFSKKNQFFQVNPINDCNHHCVVNIQNEMIVEYLQLDKDHLEFT